MTDVLLLRDAHIRESVTMAEAIASVEQAFRDLAEGRGSMPPKTYLLFPEYGGDLRVMPSSLGPRFAGVKIVNVHLRNPERGLPTVAGTYVLVSQETGVPLAIMGGTYLTALRTAAASAVATKYMARPGASTVGLVGSGVQARFQLKALAEIVPVTEAFVWAPADDRGKGHRFVEEMKSNFPNTSFLAVDEVEKAASADVVCTTTPSRSPVVPDAAVRNGTHINAVGADGPGKQELDPAILRRAWLIVDDWEQARHGGEVNVPLASGELKEDGIVGSLAQVISGETPGRRSDLDVTVFDSTGLAIEDLAVASLAYERALQNGLGTRVEL